MQIKPVTKKQNIVVQELDKELLVYDLETDKAFVLNETSAIIYGLCDGTKSISEISDSMSRKLKTPVSEDFVRLALNELKRDGLLKNKYEDYFAGMSRREMVKKIGFASLIALPVISAVVAPPAANAQSSCLPPGARFCAPPQPDVNSCTNAIIALTPTACCAADRNLFDFDPNTGTCCASCCTCS